MPELPEVEVVRRGVQRWAAGRTVTGVQVHDARSLRRYAEGPEHFVAALTGARLELPQRRGKFLWVPLAGRAEALMIHLGMSGQVLMETAAAPAEKHLKVTLQLEAGITDDVVSQADGPGDAMVPDQVSAPGGGQGVPGNGQGMSLPDQLRFVDQRIFGGMQISPLVRDGATPHASGSVPAAAAHIAPDPLEEAVTAERMFAVLRRRRTGLKRALLDQTMISGVGNIYADEALWRARLHYARRSETITRAEAAGLLQSLREVMTAALEAGGTSFDALYVNVNGASGYFDRSLQAYGQVGLPCSRCAESTDPRRRERAVIRRDKLMGRSSFWCPVCQPRPRIPRW